MTKFERKINLKCCFEKLRGTGMEIKEQRKEKNERKCGRHQTNATLLPLGGQ